MTGEANHIFTHSAYGCELTVAVTVSDNSRLATKPADVNLITYRAMNLLRDELRELAKEQTK